MPSPGPRTSFTLLRDFSPKADPAQGLADLRQQLGSIPELAEAHLEPHGASTVVASVPAANQTHSDGLKALLKSKVSGWQVIDDQNYELPKTF